MNRTFLFTKKTLLTAVMLPGITLSFAQTAFSKLMVYNNERAIGRMTETQKEIRATEYIFPNNIYIAHANNVSNTATVQLREPTDNGKRMQNYGKIVQYDLSGKTVKWTKNISYITSAVQQSVDPIIFMKKGKSSRLNPEDGQNMWKINNTIYFIDAKNNIAIGYKHRSLKVLRGIDLNNGKRIWKRDLNRGYGWNDTFWVNDSTWMVVAGGLHTVNIYDGSGWSYNDVTGDTYAGINYPLTAIGIASGFFTGTFYLYTSSKLIRDLISNVYSDSTRYYFASREKLSRVHKNEGTAAWFFGLPAGYPSKSYLFARADTLFMVNHGFAFIDYRQINYGTPFFAAFNKETGNQMFFTTINLEKNPILDFSIKNDYVLFVFKDRLMKYSLHDGSQIIDKTVNVEETDGLVGFAKDGIYIDAPDSHLANLVLSDTSKHYIVANSGKVLIFDTDLNITGDIDFSQLYKERLRFGHYTLVSRDNKSFIIDANNKKVAEIDTAAEAANVAGNKLYFFSENILFEIDLAGLTRQ